MRLVLTVLAVALSIGLALVAPPRARAACDAAVVLSRGIMRADCTQGDRAWVQITALLDEPDVGVRVAKPGERNKLPAEFAGLVAGSVAVVQAGVFAFPAFSPNGLTVGQGQAWTDTMDDPLLGVLALDESGTGLMVDPEQVVPFEPWMHSVVSGPMIARDGTALPCFADGCDAGPRTALGLSEDHRLLVIIVARGWSTEYPGVTDNELAEIALGAGAQDVIRTGDGPTSSLWAAGAMAVQSSDGAPRPSAALVALVNRDAGPTTRIVGVVQDRDGTRLPAARIRIETRTGRVVASGPTSTTTAYWEFTVPDREYMVFAAVDGYPDGCQYCPPPEDPIPERWCSVFMMHGVMPPCDLPALGVDAGPWPIGDASASYDAGHVRDGAVGPGPGFDGGCTVAIAPVPARPLGHELVFVALIVVRIARSRARSRQRAR